MTEPSASEHLRFGLVCAANRSDVLNNRLLSSPGLSEEPLHKVIKHDVSSAAAAFNAALETTNDVDWWIWVHQDVYLPGDWFATFRRELTQALVSWKNLAVAGAYGIALDGQRGGNILDRGHPLHEPLSLPCQAQSLDELLIAIRADSGLFMDERCGFDFYATDLVLQASEQGLPSAILDIYCEHWSSTPKFPPFPEETLMRIARSAEYFESKWTRRLPILTPCISLTHPGSAATQIQEILARQKVTTEHKA